MSRNDDDLPDVLSLLAAICDDAADQESLKRLEELAGQDDGRMDLILDYLQLHFDLRFELASRIASDLVSAEVSRMPVGPSADSIPPTFPSSVVAHPSAFILHRLESFGGVMVCYLIVAMMLGAGVLAAWRWNVEQRVLPVMARAEQTVPGRPGAPPADRLGVARITRLVDCRWAEAPLVDRRFGEPTPGVAHSFIGGFALASGLMELTYNTGVRVVIEGPAEYVIEAKNGGFLASGTVTVYAENEGKPPPEKDGSAAGQASRVVAEPSFFLRTPDLLVTNRGADFRVAVRPPGKDRAYAQTHAYVLRGATMLTYNRTSRASFYNAATATEMAERQLRKGAPTCYAGQQAVVNGGTGITVVPD